MNERSLWRNFDWSLLLAVLLLCGIGIAMVYSATRNTVDLADLWQRQALFVAVGLVALIVAALIDYRHLELLAPPAFLIFVGLLLVVHFFGESQGTGSQRWIPVGGTLVQPTEPGKFLLIVFMAWYMSWFSDRMHQIQYLLVLLALLAGPHFLIFSQPDLGMTITYAFLSGTLILAGGIRFWQLFMLSGGFFAGLPLFYGSLQGYMLERIHVFLNPASDPDAAFNINQALIAIGNGGWLGQGFGLGSQSQLHFLRVRHTDFIFSVIAEELGWVGAMLVLALLCFVIWRLLRIAELSSTHFGRLIAIGVAAIIFFGMVVNVGMNLNLLPVTGLTLPFISYGGSSLIATMLAVGMAESVVMRHRKIEFL